MKAFRRGFADGSGNYGHVVVHGWNIPGTVGHEYWLGYRAGVRELDNKPTGPRPRRKS